jgi:DnaA N-terminal domain
MRRAASACRRLRRSSEFLPSIKVVLDALEAVKSEAVPSVDPAPLGEPGELLLRHFGPAVFQSWMAKLTVVDQSGPELILSAPTAFVRSRIFRDYADDILRCWQQTNPNIRTLRLIVMKKADQ